MILRLALLSTLAGPVAAGDVPYDPTVLDACLSVGTGPGYGAPCIGVAAAYCADRLPPGAEVMSFAACHDAETAQWQARLDESLAAARNAITRSAPEGQTGWLDQFNAAQTSWEGYRQADCDTVLALPDASGTAPASVAACRLTRTAARAIEVEKDYEVPLGPLGSMAP